MTLNEKDIQIALGTYLPEVWKERCKLCAEGSKLWAEGLKLCAEGSKLCAEGDKLYAEGNKLFTDAVVEVYGKDIIEWEDCGCIVDGREYIR